MRILKVALNMGINQVPMQEDATALHVEFQGLNLCMWFDVSSDQATRLAKTVTRRFRVVATGEDFEIPKLSYVGTAVTAGLVLHVLEEVD